MSADPDDDAGDDDPTAPSDGDDTAADDDDTASGDNDDTVRENSPTRENAPPGENAHTGEGVDTIGGRESTRADDREWEFSLEDIAERERENDDEEGGNIAGSLTSDEPLEPGDIDLENAFFVLLGVLIVVGFIASLVLAV